MSQQHGEDVERSNSPSPHKEAGIARLPLNLRAHKLPLAIFFTITLVTSCIFPLIGYFALHYETTLKTQIILSIVTPVFGVVSLNSFFTRTIRLARSSSTCRPLGSRSAWTLDYFDWNFAFGFSIVSVIIAIGISRKPSNLRMCSLPLSILLLQVCGQMVLLIPLRAMGMRAPFRFSSLEKGEVLRPAIFTIVEDVVAVDGKQGDVFRAAWKARYESSAPFRALLDRLDSLWGASGVLVAAVVIAVIFGVKDAEVGWAVGKFFTPVFNQHFMLT